MAKSNSAERFRLRDAFEAVRSALAVENASARLDRALAYWALPADRRLPVALLDRSLREIVDSSFDRLAATPGIGQKKLDTLVLLMRRASESPAPDSAARTAVGGEELLDSPRDLNPDTVSETDWEVWRATAEKHDLGRERLGRLAPSLLDLPTVIWATPLRDYFPLTLQEVRSLKTHGEKRVRVVLEVFRSLHGLLGEAGKHSRLAIRLAPRFVPPIEDWFCEICRRSGAPDWHDLRENLVLPLVNQLAFDAGPQVQKLAEGRLGIEGTCESVRTLARRANVTRARVYQLLETCQRVMAVRWPEGRIRFDALAIRMDEPSADGETRMLYHAARELFYPTRPALLRVDGAVEDEVEEEVDGEVALELDRDVEVVGEERTDSPASVHSHPDRGQGRES